MAIRSNGAQAQGLAAARVEETVRAYRNLHDDEGAGVEERKKNYTTLVNSYYDLVTDFYEHGWGRSFHFAPRHRDETLRESIVRHEHYFAHRLGLRPGMKVIDVGCGIGGPMSNIARFSGATITGINNNAYQISRGQELLRRAGLEGLCSFLKADFMKLPLADGSIDAAYEFEALVHAPDPTAAYAEIFRVLKPGAMFVGSEWCLTDRYDPSQPEHRAIKKGIEEGDGLPDIPTTRQVDQALRDVGFELVETRDLAGTSDPETPWYLPISSKERSLRGLRLSKPGRAVTRLAVRSLELLRVAPRGSVEVSDVLVTAADALRRGGELAVFTPMYFVCARKPAR